MDPARRWEPDACDESPCRACGGTGRPLFVKRGYSFRECNRCGCRFVSGPVPALVYDEGYFNGDSFGGYPAYLQDRDLIGDNFRRRVDWLTPLARGRRLLDVGAAYGLLVEAARGAGFDAVGLEPAGACVAWARDHLEVEMIEATVEDARIPPASFDVVTMMDVVEHLAEPSLALHQIRRWLRPGGLLVIETGDCESLLARICGRRWYYYDPPQHLTYFHRRSLSEALSEAGFDPLIATANLSRAVSLRNFSHQLGRALGGGRQAELARRLARSTVGRATFRVPDWGNVMLTASRVRPADRSTV